VIGLPDTLEISPAIVAGRIRWETADYKRFGSLVGYRQVREQFELAWMDATAGEILPPGAPAARATPHFHFVRISSLWKVALTR
jgi:hypothetical protein